MTNCPSEDELVQLVEGALSSDALAVIEAHIDTCEDCAAVVGGLGAGGAPAKPRQVGRYLLDRWIRTGCTGEVWSARDGKQRRDLAIHLRRPGNASERERLLRDAQTRARLDHPNLTPVHDVGEAGGDVFIATELPSGDTVASRGGIQADWRTVVGLYAQAARGLAAAHAVDLAHGDVRPELLLVDAAGRVRVAQLGVAFGSSALPSVEIDDAESLAARAEGLVSTGDGRSDSPYLAPEQRAGDPASAPSDQYALCRALVEAIAGERPPLNLDAAALVAFVRARRAHEPGLDELCAVLARGLSLLVHERWATTSALADALDAIVPPTGIAAQLAERARTTSASTASAAPASGPRGAPASGPRTAPGGAGRARTRTLSVAPLPTNQPTRPPTAPTVPIREATNWPRLIVILLLVGIGAAIALALVTFVMNPPR